MWRIIPYFSYTIRLCTHAFHSVRWVHSMAMVQMSSCIRKLNEVMRAPNCFIESGHVPSGELLGDALFEWFLPFLDLDLCFLSFLLLCLELLESLPIGSMSSCLRLPIESMPTVAFTSTLCPEKSTTSHPEISARIHNNVWQLQCEFDWLRGWRSPSAKQVG